MDNSRRSRSRSNTPLITSETTSITRISSIDVETIAEGNESEVYTSPPAHRTRNALKQKGVATDSSFAQDQIDTSSMENDYPVTEEDAQNIKNTEYEYTSTRSINYSTNGSRTFDTSHGLTSFNLSQRNSYGSNRSLLSPAFSDKSNESFVDSVLADSREISSESVEHLPYRVYKRAVEYWNKYPKTDYTYSSLSRDRVELAPGQIAVPNMSRLSLNQYRQGMSVYNGGLNDEESKALHDRSVEIRKRHTDSSYSRSTNYRQEQYGNYDEVDSLRSNFIENKQRWWITRLFIAMYTSVVSGVTRVKNSVFQRNTTNNYSYYTNVNRYNTYSENSGSVSSSKNSTKRRRWLWLLIPLLLPLLLMCWYYQIPSFLVPTENKDNNYIQANGKFELTDDMLKAIVLHVQKNLPENMNKPQIIEKIIESSNNIDPTILIQQQDLIAKLVTEVDYLKMKLSANENIDEQISALVAKHSKETLINFFGLPNDASALTQDNMKSWINQHAISKEDVDAKLASGINSMSDKIHKDFTEIIKFKLSQQQENILSNLPSHYHASSAISQDGNCNCGEYVHKIVRDAIALYDADKTGKVDFALESAGGQIISTRCSESYQPRTAVFSVFGIPLWYPSNSPRVVLSPGTSPGECWAFQGFPGYLVIKLHTRIHVRGFTVEHISTRLSPTDRIDSAPKNFIVLGLQNETDQEPTVFGAFEYLNNSTTIQYFPIEEPIKINPDAPPGFEIVELRVESNHGHPHYTCLYRFRVHGYPVGNVDDGNIPER